MIRAIRTKDGIARVKHLIKALGYFDPEAPVQLHNGKHYVNLESVVPSLKYKEGNPRPSITVVIRGEYEL